VAGVTPYRYPQFFRENTVKYCTKCNIEKPLSDFNKRNNIKSGLRSECRTCQNIGDKERRRLNPKKASPERIKRTIELHSLRKAILVQYSLDYLRNHPCIDCGESDPVVLDYDHVRGVKKRNVCRIIANGLPLLVLQEEIAKCEIRCANCHRRKTWGHIDKFKGCVPIGRGDGL
jgi:hypothetical protein